MGKQSDWVLRRRYIELCLNLRASWEIYIRFYTVFLTFSMAALAWTLANDQRSMPVHMVAWAFAAQTVMTAITSLLIALHSRNVRRQLERIEVRLLGTEQPELQGAQPPISVPMAAWAGGANCVAMVAMACIWVYLALR